jgi:hypothetical protein
MKREIRHPYQILSADELVVGQDYALVLNAGYLIATVYTFGGIIKHSKDKHKESVVSDFVDKPDTSYDIFTIHLDGWYFQHSDGNPVVVYWRGEKHGWDQLCIYLGDEILCSRYLEYFIVPKQRWDDDPQIYPSPVERKMQFTSNIEVADAANWEKEMRRRKHDAMKKVLGF